MDASAAMKPRCWCCAHDRPMSVVFLTGGTGVVGSTIARTLLETSGLRLKLLTRGESDDNVRERLRSLAQFWKLSDSEVAARVEMVRGNTSLPRFGLDPTRFERIAAECARIIHCAAIVRMNLPLAEARAAAVSAAENVAGACPYGQARGHSREGRVSEHGRRGRYAAGSAAGALDHRVSRVSQYV